MSAALKISSSALLLARQTELVTRYNTLVRHIAYRVLGKLPPDQVHVELDDLIHIGMLGLFEADAKFDGREGPSFETFAEFRVRGAMLDELRKRDFFPRRLRAKANRIQRVEAALRSTLGRAPLDEELAAQLQMTIEQLHAMRREIMPYSFINQDDPALQLRAEAPSSFDTLASAQRHALLASALQHLPRRDQIVLDLYFHQELPQREIAHLMALTEGRISQIKSAALAKLRRILITLDA